MKVFSPSRMKEARLAKGYSQSELARAMNTREQNVSRWESAANLPSANVVASLAYATDKPIEFFYVEDESVAVDAQQAAIEAKAREMLVGASADLVQALFQQIGSRLPAQMRETA